MALALLLGRGVAVAALLSAFGALVFGAAVLPRALAQAPAALAAALIRRVRAVARVSLVVALLAMPGWAAMQAAALAPADGAGRNLLAVPDLLLRVLFGQFALAGAAACGFALLALRGAAGHRRGRLAVVFAGVAVILHAGHLHGFAMQGVGLLAGMEALHLLAAGAWLGGLLPLLLVVAAAPPAVGAAACRWFSPLGKACVVAMVLSAVWQGATLVGGVAGFVGTAYGRVALAKAALFGGLLGFAWANRWRFAPALRGADPPAARWALQVSLALQTVAGLATVGVAVVLTSLPPGIHEQPDWPFPARLSFAALAEPELRGQAIAALAGLALAVAVVGVGLVRRHWPAVALGLACGAVAVPQLDLLLVPAHPTSFYRSPTGFAAASIAAGAALFPAGCAACHGDNGAGDGPLGASLPVPPADLTAPHLWDHADGELFWWLAQGMRAPSGAAAMPGFAGRLPDETLWALIDFVRARNAGAAYARDGAWPVPRLHAPGFDADCPDGAAQAFGDFRGGMVWLTILAANRVGLAVAGPDGADGAVCTATGEDIVAAYAVLTGSTPGALAGSVFLVDGEGWLRARLPPGSDNAGRRRILREMSAPLAPAEDGVHRHPAP